jgi:hypothetical protein
MEILRVKTNFAQYKLGDVIKDENYIAYCEQDKKINTVGSQGNLTVYTHHPEEFPFLVELSDKLKYVTKINFYPEENKFEIMSDDDIMATIVSTEYFIENKKVGNN